MRTRTEVIADVLKVLELAVPRSGMYMEHSRNIDGFCDGMYVMAACFGLHVPYEIYMVVQEERGWRSKVAGRVCRQYFLDHTNMTDNEIAHEMLTIELEAWRRTFGAELEGAGEA